MVTQSLTVTNRVVVFGELYDENGHPVVTALELRPDGNIENLVKVASAYSKNSLQNLINKSDILYVDPNKKRTDTWLQTLRLQLPAGVTKYGSIGMVTYVEKDVNGKISFDNKKTAKTAVQIAFEKAQQKATNNSISEKTNNDTKFSLKDTTNESDSQTKSEAFKDWFGDWEKHPNTASKVVNEDGTPRVMYHGTKRENFTVFDSSKSDKKVKLNVLGNGYYFSSEMSGAERYGNNVMSVYLDIKKPYQVYGRDGGIEAQYQQYTM